MEADTDESGLHDDTDILHLIVVVCVRVYVFLCLCMCVCAYVCVCQRECLFRILPLVSFYISQKLHV